MPYLWSSIIRYLIDLDVADVEQLVVNKYIQFSKLVVLHDGGSDPPAFPQKCCDMACWNDVVWRCGTAEKELAIYMNESNLCSYKTV